MRAIDRAGGQSREAEIVHLRAAMERLGEHLVRLEAEYEQLVDYVTWRTLEHELQGRTGGTAPEAR